MVATSHPFATQIALDVLKEGGNAVDAAIAANAFLGLGDPGNSGIGGDLFAVVWDAKTKQLYGLNASGRSARAMTLAELKRRGLTQIPANGPLAVSVPGCVDGWFALHGRFGSKPMARLLAPTIAYARDGLPVAPDIADDSNLRLSQRLPSTPPGSFANLRALYMPGGSVPEEGRDLPQSRAGLRRSRQIATRRPRRVLQGPHRRRDRRAHQGAGRLPLGRGFRRAHLRLGHAGQHDVPRLPRLGAAAQHAGQRRPADAQRARGRRPGEGRLRQRRPRALVHRSQEARVRGSRRRVRRAAIHARVRRSTALEGLRGDAPRPREARSRGRVCLRIPRRQPHRVPHDGRQGRQHGVAHPEQLAVVRLAGSGRGPRLRAAQPRHVVRADRGTPEQLRARQAAVPHDHPGVRDQGRPAVHELRPDGRRHAAAGPRADPA